MKNFLFSKTRQRSMSLLVLFISIIFVFVLSGCASVSTEKSGGDDTARVSTNHSESEKAIDIDGSIADTAPSSETPVPEGRPMKEAADESEAPIMSFASPGLEEAKRTSSGSPRGGGDRPSSVPSESGLKAGFSDDNAQYGYFLNFLDEYSTVPHHDLNVSERIMFRIVDTDGVPVPNALLTISTGISANTSPLISGMTLADGTYYFFPADFKSRGDEYTCTVEYEGHSISAYIKRNGPRTVEMVLGKQRNIGETVPVDILFIMDTTGSMGDEIQRLKSTIELIYLNLKSLPGGIDPRFGMVLYKDYGDEYVTQVIPLTADLELFQNELDAVYASGGGDYPEELQAAMDASIKNIQWNRDGIRLGYIITDAPPQMTIPLDAASNSKAHLTYAESVRLAKQWGIKYHSVGTGGLDLQGEYVLRQIAQYTGGRYIFLTYGETGESEGGAAGSVSHHTGANFQTDKLESIIIRFTKEEISSFINQPLPEPEPYITAVSIDSEKKKDTLNKLFTMSLDQLFDFSTIALEDELLIAVLPIQTKQPDAAASAEYFSHELLLAAGAHSRLRLAEREDLQTLYSEYAVQLSGMTDPEGVSEIGQMLNADYLLFGDMFSKDDGYQVYLKLVRVETGEILSVTKSVIEPSLGL